MCPKEDSLRLLSVGPTERTLVLKNFQDGYYFFQKNVSQGSVTYYKTPALKTREPEFLSGVCSETLIELGDCELQIAFTADY